MLSYLIWFASIWETGSLALDRPFLLSVTISSLFVLCPIQIFDRQIKMNFPIEILEEFDQTTLRLGLNGFGVEGCGFGVETTHGVDIVLVIK